MPEKIIQLNEGIIKNELKEVVRNNVEETLNGLPEQEAQQLTHAVLGMSAVRSSRGTVAATTAGSSLQLPGM